MSKLRDWCVCRLDRLILICSSAALSGRNAEEPTLAHLLGGKKAFRLGFEARPHNQKTH